MTWLRHNVAIHPLAWGLALSVVALACVLVLIIRHVADRKTRRVEANRPLRAARSIDDMVVKRSRDDTAAAFADIRRLFPPKPLRSYTKAEFEAVFGACWSEDERFLIDVDTLADFRDLDALHAKESDR